MPGEAKYISLFILVLVICTLSFSPAAALTADPMDYSVGARSVGMGKAYVAVAEDSETVFINPAGLGSISTLKLGSMYTSLLEDVNYTVISAAYPLDNDSGTLGAGLISQASNQIELADITGGSQGTGSYGSNMLFISHGVNLTKKFFPGIQGLYGGYTVKYLSKSAEGYNCAGINGSGYSADLGLLYKPKGYISYGLNLQNILASSMTYQNGFEEEIGAAAVLGTRVAVMGDSLDGGAMYQNDSKLDVSLDYGSALTGTIPGTMHLGIEYKPLIGVNYIDRILTLRAGINQVPCPSGTINNPTVGLGINYEGVEFNFAYSPNYTYPDAGEIPNTATYFFSLSYIGVPKPVQKIEEMKPLISQLSPEDKLLTKDSALRIEGTVSDVTKVIKVDVNDVTANIAPSGTFEMGVPLSTIGKHLVVVRATDIKGNVEEHKIRVIKLIKFADVKDDFWASDPIAKIATAGLVEGYPDGTFQPQRALSRAELATLLVKSKGMEPPIVTGRIFKDVPPSHWASRYIKGALDMGLVQGYPDKTFKPNNKINRTEGVVVLSRFGELQAQAKLESAPYPDLTARYWASPLISAAREAGLLDYLGDESDFEPKRELTRAEAIEILSKTSYGKASVDSMLDWTVGFEQVPMKAPVAATPITPTAGKRIMPYAQASQVKSFSDVPDEFWASDSIKYLATAGVMGGYPDGTFRPDRIVTRAELSALLVKAKNIPVANAYTTGYSDVSRNNWAASYIKTAVDNGYMTGRAGGKFEPNRGASRAETVSAMVKFDELALPDNLRSGPFPDMTAREWSSKYVAAAKEAGMLKYLEGQDFEAEKSITRAELAEIIAKSRFGQEKIQQVKTTLGVVE